MEKRYCKAIDKQIIDQYGHPLLLKGVGIGGWLLLEGYMIKSYQTLDRPRRIKEYISSYLGEAYADYFFEEWFQRFFQKEDVHLIKKLGFNCIRIPIDYQFLFVASDEQEELSLIEEHFSLLDQIIEECKKEHLYVMLDLHAAPGGQTGTNIDNSWDDLPRLFLEPLYQKQTIYIWTTLAKRYKEEEYIVGYDLLNEPLPNWFAKYNHQLMPLYQKIIEAIRTVDPYHMISLEGLHWSTDLSIFASLKEDNILLQFHKYWSNPDSKSIEEYLALREKLQLPLIMGEGGENNTLWYSAVFKMYQQLDISYAFWTYKKMDANNSIIEFDMPNDWDKFLLHQLSKEEAKHVLDTLLHHIQFEHTKIHEDVANHIMQKDRFQSPAYGFDYKGKNVSCYTKEHHHSSFRVNEGVKIANREGEVIVPNFKQYNGEEVPKEDRLYVFLFSGEWVEYSFFVGKDQELAIKVECDKNAQLTAFLDQEDMHLNNGQKNVFVKEGTHILRILAKEDVRLASISFSK